MAHIKAASLSLPLGRPHKAISNVLYDHTGCVSELFKPELVY